MYIPQILDLSYMVTALCWQLNPHIFNCFFRIKNSLLIFDIDLVSTLGSASQSRDTIHCIHWMLFDYVMGFDIWKWLMSKHMKWQGNNVIDTIGYFVWNWSERKQNNCERKNKLPHVVIVGWNYHMPRWSMKHFRLIHCKWYFTLYWNI